MPPFHTRVWGSGHCDAAADAPDNFKDAVVSALSQCVRLTPSIDRREFVERLVGKSVPPAIAQTIAETATIISDDAFFTSQRPY